MDDCIFCKILTGELPSEKLYEDEQCVVIKDKYPSAPTHWLVLPKKHIRSIADMEESDSPLIGHLVWVAKRIAQEKGIKGYKLVWNVNKEGGQVVFHIHLHILAGNLEEIHFPSDQ